jgi:asparagine synthase (glutamine-hydrolysing)
MCGISGSVNFKFNTEIINDVMGHRGPDERFSYISDNVMLHHLRLSILDSQGGRQPMHLGESYTIIFNGEIYNHGDLRKKYNLVCKTSSDTETLLKLYEKTGVDFLNDLDGMFAFAILDKANNKLVFARDRSGKKPLYYYNQANAFIFASELNAIRKFITPSISINNIKNYLQTGVFYKEATPYSNVFEFPPGSYGELDLNTLSFSINKWWHINDQYVKDCDDDFETVLENVDSFLTNAVIRRIDSSDLEVGAFLSGGIDSGLVTSIASKHCTNLKTFTVSFDGNFDEAPLAKLVANKYGTSHTEINIKFDNLLNDIEKILTNYGEPFCDSSAIPSYYVSKEAKKHLTVILNGDGADELFGGYRRYVPFAKYNFFKAPKHVNAAANLLVSILPNPEEKKSKINLIHRLASLAGANGINTYFSATADLFVGLENYFIEPITNDKQLLLDFEAKLKLSSGLKTLMAMDFDTILSNNLLVKMDIATMANSLEGRSPFLCKELLEYVPSINDEFKIKGASTKHVLRTLAQKYLPAELINQPKRGFEIPLQSWVDNELSEIIKHYLLDADTIIKQITKNQFVEKLINGALPISREKRAKVIWAIFSMEVWYKKVYLS